MPMAAATPTSAETPIQAETRAVGVSSQPRARTHANEYMHACMRARVHAHERARARAQTCYADPARAPKSPPVSLYHRPDRSQFPSSRAAASLLFRHRAFFIAATTNALPSCCSAGEGLGHSKLDDRQDVWWSGKQSSGAVSRVWRCPVCLRGFP